MTSVEHIPEVVLLCLPGAGGTPAAYRGWSQSLAPDVEVQPLAIPKPADGSPMPLRESAGALAGKLSARTGKPYAFFGHSLGAIVAFETIRALLAQRCAPPLRLFVCGSSAPEKARDGQAVHELPDDEFLDKVAALGGLSPEVTADEELRLAFLPGLRADYRMAETYVYEPGPPLPCPISVFHGQNDSLVDPGALPRWRDHTTGEMTLRTVPGDHFLLQESAALLHRAIREDLRGEPG